MHLKPQKTRPKWLLPVIIIGSSIAMAAIVLGITLGLVLGGGRAASAAGLAADYGSPQTCQVQNPGPGKDAAPFIVEAFRKCAKNGKVVFDNSTYSVNSVMDIRGLDNVEIDQRGTLVWSKDLDYWLKHSYPVGFQDQSTAFILSGNRIHWNGHGTGTFDGNGQTWYDKYGKHNNYPGRPHALTLYGFNNSIIEGMRFIQSQMWTMSVLYSQNDVFRDIYVNSTWLGGGDGEARRQNQNTDGVDTVWSNNMTFTRWTVDNGDDAISAKTNSTNILVEDCTFYRGLGIALGSIGQFLGEYEIIENFTVKNLKVYNAPNAAYAKVWGYIPGGKKMGGATGYVKNFNMENVYVENVKTVMEIHECYGYFGNKEACKGAKIDLSDFSIKNVTGTLSTDNVVKLSCGEATPCKNIALDEVSVKPKGPTPAYLCDNVEKPDGFTCTGPATTDKPGAHNGHGGHKSPPRSAPRTMKYSH